MPVFYAATISFLAGIALRVLVAFPSALLLPPFVLGAAFLVAASVSRSRLYRIVGACVVLFAFGCLRAALAPQALPPAFERFLDTKTTFTGTVVADPDVRETNTRVMVRVQQRTNTTRVLAVLPVGAQLAYGETVEITGKFKKPTTFESDGGRTFRYDHYLEKDGVFALMQPATATVRAPPHGFARVLGTLYALKDLFARGLQRSLPHDEAGLAEGLITGGKQQLGKDLLAAFTAAGIVQIVVLSGYNVMIIAEAVMNALSWLPKKIAITSAATGLIAFVVAAGSGSSALRAAAMACLALFAKASGRSYDALRALTLTVAIMTAWNPYALTYDPSFQLSVLATYGLILGVPVVEPWFGWLHNAAVRDAVCTTVAAELAVLPLLLWQTGNLSLVSVFANVAVSFIVPAAMAASAIAGFAGMIVPHSVAFAAPLIALPAYAVLWTIVHSAIALASLPFAQITLPAFPRAVVIGAYALELWIVMPACAGSAPRTRPS